MHPVLKKIYTLIDENLLNTGNKKEAIVLSKTIKNLKKPQDVYNALFDAPKGSVNVVICNQLLNKFNWNWGFIFSLYRLLVKNQLATSAV